MDLRVATWNLERVLPFQSRARRIRERMGTVGADIWVLTETHESLAPEEGFFGTFSGEPDRPSKPGERWVGIWSRQRAEPLEGFVSDPARCAAARILLPGIGDIIVFGCVLPWVGSEWRGIGYRNGAFDAALESCSADWRNLRAAHPDAIFVVAGDFNQDLAPKHYYGSGRQRHILEASLRAAGLEAVTAREQDPVARDSPGYACIDHICVSREPGLPVRRTVRWPYLSAPDKRLSDHFGIAADFSL